MPSRSRRFQIQLLLSLNCNIFKSCQVRGEIENWLSSFEKQMLDSLRQELRSTLNVDFQTLGNKIDWMSELVPAQILLLKCQVVWCQATEYAMTPNQSDESQNVFSAWKENHMTGIIDQCSFIGDCVIQLQRSKLSAVLTQEIHHRDVLQRLHEGNVRDARNFDWQMCLRCYWSMDTALCQFKQISSCLTYTFEYWGATRRLVITALTEKCFLTLTSALHLMLGGAPFGPAGTGKTETTKDLAKTLGRQCIVFNCGVRIDFKNKFNSVTLTELKALLGIIS
jgi:dynein heavy chain